MSNSEEIYNAILRIIKNIYLTNRFIFIIDGLDDILNNTEFKAEIITGLIRASDIINSSIKKCTINVKIILLIRDDVLNLCRDPNLSKILRDSSIRLNWAIDNNPYESDLLKLVEKRVDIALNEENSLPKLWSKLFPEKISNKSSLEYVLDNIIYRPRDILQFFIEAQKSYSINKNFSSEDLRSILSSYSNDYFIEALRDELTGFFPNDFVTKLPDILSHMGSQYFYLSKFENECNKYPEFKEISKADVLEKLFVAGYIGQHRPRDSGDYTVFSYRNFHEKFIAEHECILHRGLLRALTI